MFLFCGILENKHHSDCYFLVDVPTSAVQVLLSLSTFVFLATSTTDNICSPRPHIGGNVKIKWLVYQSFCSITFHNVDR